MAEQRYLAVLAVIAEGHPIASVAQHWGVWRQTLHAWLRRYGNGGLEELADRSHRPVSCLHQTAVHYLLPTIPRWRCSVVPTGR